MKRLKPRARLAMGVGVLSMISVIAAHLALTEIAHGEADLALEWGVLRFTAVVTVLFQVAALTTLWKISSASEHRS